MNRKTVVRIPDRGRQKVCERSTSEALMGIVPGGHHSRHGNRLCPIARNPITILVDGCAGRRLARSIDDVSGSCGGLKYEEESVSSEPTGIWQNDGKHRPARNRGIECVPS